MFALRADNASVVSMARDRVAAWLAGHRWPAEESHDIVYAVSEAVTNVCEHAYDRQEAGTVEITAHVEHPTARDAAGAGVGDRRGALAAPGDPPVLARPRPAGDPRADGGRPAARVAARPAPGTSLVLTSPSVPA